jgi:hypothetical protein
MSGGRSQNHQSNESGHPVIITNAIANSPFLLRFRASQKSQMNDHIDKRRIAITPGNTRTAGPSSEVDPIFEPLDSGNKR